MTAYLIGEVVITDESWVSSYAINVHEIVHKHGGKYLSRSGNIKQVEGIKLVGDQIYFTNEKTKSGSAKLSKIDFIRL